MALFDHFLHAESVRRREAYDKLKEEMKFDSSKYDVYSYLLDMENSIRELKEEVTKYREFFSKLGSLLPDKGDGIF